MSKNRDKSLGLPENLVHLISRLDSSILGVEALTTLPSISSRKGSWKIELVDGRIIKGRRLDSSEQAEKIERLAGLTQSLPLNKIFARNGDSLLEEWIPGQGLSSIPLTLDLAELLGALLGEISQAGSGSPILEPHAHHVDSLLRKTFRTLDELVASGEMDSMTSEKLTARAKANSPGRLEAGLVHLDFQARNIVMADGKPYVIDNELLDSGVFDLDLARTWYLWPMSASQQARFLKGYSRYRCTKRFLLHELFWSIHALSGAAAYQQRIGQDISLLVRNLERLAQGDLPRSWSDAQPVRDRQTQERTRLAFLCDYLAIGGQERICLNMLRGLDQSRFAPYVYAFRGGALVPEFRKLGIPVLIGSDRDPLEAETHWSNLDNLEKLHYRQTLAEALAQDRIDAALIFAWRDGVPAAQIAGVRVLIEKLDGPGLLAKIADKSPFDRVVCESVSLRDELISRQGELGLEEDRIEMIFPGINVDEFNLSRFDRNAERSKLGFRAEDLIVGTVSRLIPDKNISLLMKAFAHVETGIFSGTPYLLIMGPDGGDLDRLKTLSQDLNISDRVRFVPPNHDVASILSILDVFGMTSLREGLPTVILEAMAMSLPILTTGIGSIPEVMDGNGLLLPGYGHESLGTRLTRLLTEPELRKTMGEKSRTLSERFAQRHSTGRYEDLVLKCLEEKSESGDQRNPLGFTPTLPDRPKRLRVLAMVTRFKWTHIDYLVALSKQVELRVVVTHEIHAGAVANAKRWKLNIDFLESSLSLAELRDYLAKTLENFQPDLVHCLYYFHEQETLVVRELLDQSTERGRRPPVVFECRDPLSTLEPQGKPGVKTLERAALTAADGWIFVTETTRQYYEQLYSLELSQSLIVPHGFAERTVAPPSPKLSALDGRVHMALVGSARASTNDGRFYGSIIRRLCQQGIVVHSHFHPEPEADRFYANLAEELQDYHAHPTYPHREETILSRAMSVYDVMGVFHELEASERNESRTLAMCIPTKAICAWLLAGIPVVCYPHYRGLVEWIDGCGMGFVVSNLEETGVLTRQRKQIDHATRA